MEILSHTQVNCLEERVILQIFDAEGVEELLKRINWCRWGRRRCRRDGHEIFIVQKIAHKFT